MTDTDTCPPVPLRITQRSQLVKLADDLRLSDWHEPEQQEVNASVHGVSFDTAGFWPLTFSNAFATDEEIDGYPLLGIPDPRPTKPSSELYVTLTHRGHPVAYVNLAMLFAWASTPEGR